MGLGTGAMLLGTFSYWTTLKELRQTEKFRLGRPTLLIAVIMSVAGVALLFSIAGRLV